MIKFQGHPDIAKVPETETGKSAERYFMGSDGFLILELLSLCLVLSFPGIVTDTARFVIPAAIFVIIFDDPADV